ncbi:RHS repeat-associated core domain-containing protein, partial [Shewanella sairae]
FGKRLGGEKAGIGYTGHLQDPDLGLTYMQARYYDPLIGRFYSNDPKNAASFLSKVRIQGFNRYAYAANNPYKYVDPDGRDYKEMYISLKLPFVGSMDVGTVNFTPNASDQGNTTSGIFVRFGKSASNVENGASKGALKQEPTIQTRGAIAGLTLGKGAGSHTQANFDDPSASLDVGAAVATVSIGDFSGTESSASVEIGPSIGVDTTISKSFTLTGNDVEQAVERVTDKVREIME